MPDPELQNCHSDALTAATSLLTSTLSAAAGVQSFRRRWATISSTLTRLPLSSLPSHPLSHSLFVSLSQTLTLALTLALHCRDPNPPAGKLQTQSELASVSSALDQCLADAEVLVRAGVEGEGKGKKGECRDVVVRLQMGGVGGRVEALERLVDLIGDEEDDKNVVVAVGQGVVPVLVRVLESYNGHEAKEKAVAAIARISAVESCRYVLASEGLLLLNHLSRLLESGSSTAKEKCCVVLQTLTLNSKENGVALGSRGAISSLLHICHAGTPSSQAAAAGVLRNLAAVDDIRQSFAEENAVDVLARLCASGTAKAQENAVACVRNLAAAEGTEWKRMVFREFGVDSIKSCWDGQGRILEPAVGLVRRLAGDKYIAEQLVSSGFVPRVVGALSSGLSVARTEAARAVCELAMVSKARKEMGESNLVSRLVAMLDAKGAEEKEAAVVALAALVVYVENRRVLRKEERAIPCLVQLLNPLLMDVEKKYPVAVLLSISQSRRCRRQMVEAGVRGFLPRLVDMEVEGAKRLLDSLEKSSILGSLFGRN